MNRSNDFSTYGPPAHRVSSYAVTIEEHDDDIVLVVGAYSQTHQTSLYVERLKTGLDPYDPAAPLMVSQFVGKLVETLWQTRPNTVERFWFVAGGGLHQQLSFYDDF